MRQQRFGSLLRAGLLAGAAVGFLAPAASGQDAVITGKVTNDQGDPIPGARVGILNTNFATTANVGGVYTLTISAASAHGQDAQLTARALLHRPRTVTIKLTPGPQTMDFKLAADPLRLEEIVTTGTAVATQTNRLTFAVGKVSEEQLQNAPGTTALGALQGKVAGVSVFAANGMPGSAPDIKLRGATSITGNQSPLIVMDGTITPLASLADIASEDIERVEVVKGAAGSSLYGSNGANGVIQIFTRRGSRIPEGKIQITARTEVGQSKITRFPEVTKHHPYLLNADGSFYRKYQRGGTSLGDSVRVERESCDDALDAPNLPGGVCPPKVNIQDQAYPTDAHAFDLVYKPGTFTTQYLSIGQNRGRSNYNVSFENTQNPGAVVDLKGQRRQNYRMNLDQVLSDRFDMSFSAFYGRNTVQEPSAGGDNGPFFSLAFLEPHVNPTACCNPDGSPYRAFVQDKRSNAANPLYVLFNVDRQRERNRFSGGTRLRWRPVSWLSTEGNFNLDQLSDQFTFAEPFKYWSASSKFGSRPGTYGREDYHDRRFNTGINATGTWLLRGSGLTDNLGLTLKAAYSYEDVVRDSLASYAQSFVKEVPEFSGTRPESQRAVSQETQERTVEAFGVGTLDFNGKLILDGLLRRDESSLFGPDARTRWYYRASGSIRLPQLLGWSRGPQELRLRASYGTAGLRPNFFAQYEVLTASGGTFIKTQLGNRLLRPAHSGEFEVGANLELWHGRFTLEYNYSDKKSRDEIVNAPVKATTGFISQWQNVGALQARTHEVVRGTQLVNTRDLSFQLNITGDRVREYITDWPLPNDVFGTTGNWANYTYAPGVRLGTMTGDRWVHNLGQLYLDPAKKAASGAGQAFDPAKYSVNYDGYLVLTSNRGTPDERPIKLLACADAQMNPIECSGSAKPTNSFFLGVASPDFRVGFSPAFSYRRFTIAGLLDWNQGGQLANATAHWATQDCADARCDQSAKPADQRIAEGFYRTGLYDGAFANEAYVESATFLKIREVSVNYTFNRGELNKVGLGRYLNEVRVGAIGRNLKTWTNYRGVDPEVAPRGDDAFKGRTDWFQYPPFRTLTGFIEIAF